MTGQSAKKTDYWLVVFVVILVTVLPKIGGMLFATVNSVLLSAICGGIGGALGVGIYYLVKNKSLLVKIISLVALVTALFGSLFYVAAFKSDTQIVKRDWARHTIKAVSFEYPGKFTEMAIGEGDDAIYSMKVFSDDDDGRLAMYLLYDFVVSGPSMEESFNGSIVNALTNLETTDITYLDTETASNFIKTRFTYKIGDKEYLGFGFIYNTQNHYESVFLIPYAKEYSLEYLQKVDSSIVINAEI